MVNNQLIEKFIEKFTIFTHQLNAKQLTKCNLKQIYKTMKLLFGKCLLPQLFIFGLIKSSPVGFVCKIRYFYISEPN